MRALLGTVLAASAAIGLAAPAAAQQDHDTAWRTKPVERRAYAARDAELALKNYARCIVNRRFAHADPFVLGKNDSNEKQRLLRRLLKSSDDGCLHGFDTEVQLRFSNDILAGALGQALTAKFYPDLSSVLASHPLDAAEEAGRVSALAPGEVFARCVVRRNPGASVALVTSDADSREEQSALAALGTELGPCLLAGSTMTINALFLRNQIGIAAYRLGTEIRRPVPVAGA